MSKHTFFILSRSPGSSQRIPEQVFLAPVSMRQQHPMGAEVEANDEFARIRRCPGTRLDRFLQSTSGNLLERAQLHSGDPEVHLVPPPLKCVHLLAQRSQAHLPPGAWKICLLPGTGLYNYNPSLLTTCPAIGRPAVGSWWREGAGGRQSSRAFSLVGGTGRQKT